MSSIFCEILLTEVENVQKKDNCFRSLTIHDYLEKRHMEKVLTEEGKYCILIKLVITEITEQAAVAQ